MKKKPQSKLLFFSIFSLCCAIFRREFALFYVPSRVVGCDVMANWSWSLQRCAMSWNSISVLLLLPHMSANKQQQHYKKNWFIERFFNSPHIRSLIKLLQFITKKILPSLDSLYRSTNSIPANFDNNNTIQKYGKASSHRHSAPDSPRSTRSAGWAKSQQRGLFGITSSPKSVRSASSRKDTTTTTTVSNANGTLTGHRQRSSSVESQSSNDSRSGRRHRSRSKRISDNESEMSGRSGRSHRKHRRHRSRNRSEYGSEYNQSEPATLIDSGQQWLEVQRKQAEMSGIGSVQKAAVKNPSAVTAAATTTTDTYNRNKKSRKHRWEIIVICSRMRDA